MDNTSSEATNYSDVDKKAVLIAVSLASFLNPFMGSSINIAIPSIGREFGADAVSLSWIATAYLLAAAMFLVPLGRMADIYGRRRFFVYGVLGYTIISLLCGLAVSANMLIMLRVFQGISDAMMFGTTLAMISSVFPPLERGRVLGITVAVVYLGGALGPVIGGFITQFVGWRGIFFLTMALGALVATLVISKVKVELREAHGQRMDFFGSLLYSATLLLLIYGFSLLPSINGLWLIAASILALGAFILWERQVPYPVLDVRLFRRNLVFSLSVSAALLSYAATFPLFFLLSMYLQYVKGLDPQASGLVMLTQPLVMALFSPLAGRLSDRIEPRVVASTGMLLQTIGLIIISFSSDTTGLESIAAALVICGLGIALFSSPNMNAIMSSVDKRYYGVASAITSVVRLVGQMLSMGVTGVIIATYVGNVQIQPEHYPAFLSGFRFAFVVFAGVCLIGVFASLARNKVGALAKAEPVDIE